jgi:predicted solute-binding protein
MSFRNELDVQPLAMGWIPYWNLLPLKFELMRTYGTKLSLREGHPTVVNKLLADNQVQVAPCSSICLIKYATHEMAMPLGISSNGPVQSVYLGLTANSNFQLEEIKERVKLVREIITQAQFRCRDKVRPMAKYIWDMTENVSASPLRAIPRLKLTNHSESSATLAKIFYRLLFGKAAYEANIFKTNAAATDDGAGSLELVIGDEALVRREEFSKVIDLGQLWNHLTGLPFVFAVWQKGSRAISPSWTRRILEAAEAAQAKMHVEPSAYFPNIHPMNHSGREIDLAGYWKGLHYRLGNSDMSGLLLFLSLAKQVLRAEIDDAMFIKMERWQETTARDTSGGSTSSVSLRSSQLARGIYS